MASICTEPSGRRRIVFHDAEGIRRTIRLEKDSLRGAEQTKLRIEHLVAATIENRPVDRETSLWLNNVGAVLRNKLAKAGLVTDIQVRTLGPFITNYISQRAKLKQSTVQVLELAKKNLIAHFGADKPLRLITAGDATDFREALRSSGLAESTTRKRCSIASQIFRYAVKHQNRSQQPF